VVSCQWLGVIDRLGGGFAVEVGLLDGVGVWPWGADALVLRLYLASKRAWWPNSLHASLWRGRGCSRSEAGSSQGGGELAPGRGCAPTAVYAAFAPSSWLGRRRPAAMSASQGVRPVMMAWIWRISAAAIAALACWTMSLSTVRPVSSAWRAA
jgi:hypothetical protein